MNNATWYYAKGGQQLGPFTLTQLRQFAAAGVLLATDLVWEADAREAVPAASVPALFPAHAQSAPTPARPAGDANAPPTPTPKASPMQRWAAEYAGVGAVGAVASLFSAELRTAVIVAALTAGLMCLVAAWTSAEKPAAAGFGLLGVAVGAAAGAITFSVGVLVVGIALSAAVGAGAGFALGYAMTALNRDG